MLSVLFIIYDFNVVSSALIILLWQPEIDILRPVDKKKQIRLNWVARHLRGWWLHWAPALALQETSPLDLYPSKNSWSFNKCCNFSYFYFYLFMRFNSHLQSKAHCQCKLLQVSLNSESINYFLCSGAVPVLGMNGAYFMTYCVLNSRFFSKYDFKNACSVNLW